MELSKKEESLRMMLKVAEAKTYWDITDVMLHTGLSIATIRRRIKEGKLKKLQGTTRGKLLFRKQDVQAWLESGGR